MEKSEKPFKDPSAETEHLTPGGKIKHKKINRSEQALRHYDKTQQIPDGPPGEPPVVENETVHSEYWWEKD